ncbi:hypothetical protein Taro_041823 [Colocasia esculenta]|uniref:Uncharacterized protein n=1 Tax=Colocasia esculenta TaxID=4460 RepID=A0A843WUP9_COLES|nr:hypothetical protein [Colocasia esculenta]
MKLLAGLAGVEPMLGHEGVVAGLCWCRWLFAGFCRAAVRRRLLTVGSCRKHSGQEKHMEGKKRRGERCGLMKKTRKEDTGGRRNHCGCSGKGGLTGGGGGDPESDWTAVGPAFLPEIRSQYQVYEDVFFKKIKDELLIVREQPTLACGVAIAASLLLMRGPRRFLFRQTFGRFQDKEVASMLALVKQQKSELEKEIVEISEQGIRV